MQVKTPGGQPRLSRLRGWKASAVTLAATALLAAGCGGLSGSGQPAATGGSLAASGINLAGQTFTVGGKDFDEQLFLDEGLVGGRLGEHGDSLVLHGRSVTPATRAGTGR